MLRPARRDTRASDGRDQAGFTLIETIVALMLFSGMFVLLNQGLTAGWQAKRRADQDVKAVAFAAAQLASAGIEVPLVDGTRTLGQQGVFSWALMIDKYTESNDEAGDATRRTVARLVVAAYWVAIDVSWPSGPLLKQRTLRLRTLKLGRS
jgi:prepilin-type N-terminal cleavage/methylation domain-containing protein